MADEPKAGDPMHNVWWFLGLLLVLAMLWYFAGGPSRADLRGIFLNPPPPVGPDGAYNPESGTLFETGTVAPPERVPQYQY